MPMQCSRCEHIQEGREETCPKCGARMHFTLLAALKPAKSDEGMVSVEALKPPTVAQRIGQWLRAVFFSHLFGGMLLLFGGFAIISVTNDLTTLKREHPIPVGFFFTVVSLAGIAAGTMVGLRGVYLSQLVGLVAGATCGAMMMSAAEKILHVWVPWYLLPLPPVAGAVVGFFSGLVVRGELVIRQETKYKPIDTWDRTVKPTVREEFTPPSTRWRQLLLGIGCGVLVYPLSSYFLALVMSPLFPTGTAAALSRVDPILHAIGLLAGGVAAGALTNTGRAQGFVAGLVIFSIDQAMDPVTSSMFPVMLAWYLFLTTLGGFLGQKIFHPTQAYVNTGAIPAEVKAISAEIQRPREV